jgi:NAD(P)-dependent dehydrogenase (short-subunit alcohol dehydrogenase family)
MRVTDPDRRNLLEGKVCLITGGGGSLGRATARLFLKEGARVVLTDRNPDALAAAQAALDDVNVSVIAGDATVEADVARAMDTVVDRHGALDVLVANAGTPSSFGPITECDVVGPTAPSPSPCGGCSSPASTACGCSPRAAAW